MRRACYIRRETRACRSRRRGGSTAGACLRTCLQTYAARLSILSKSELTLRIVEGLDVGRSETVQYQASCVRPGVFIASFPEANRETVVDVHDFARRIVHTQMTLEDNRFVRITGNLRDSVSTTE
jgi:hypothetical protein